ncbi:2-heptaprenyl-1,4-naphthoquinone methyltransferase [Pseudonocardia sp. Ae168_Ps1]|uniref:class I SAM-dependent methyltransferase n=1 Tax=unclassified Pseudonocardia TaxID=2619320 RepID=UPI00095BA511|nr:MULTISPECIES: class I SAM-dependent methyltransferase [unclassified Pseudonocardia]OLL72385.1 2-heptaprenyl-1,4-naphthoquinone methyltransferase [Pseudonocardia sp. Ae150A_Ps1]OLL78357.1 2-heptaprenyl-1,4-naphthoquinone methyltransferase [Pseudonocardia sp. Ae168_Ps1]OLL87517.1 2-heptaprenyl-1,4-naphthoquinone methyltransferase [Pseudonocardia sp. Ae263_Ps1]OLL92453.1 2-heptaprenyl-1,4-naphthoquinone methyltransferase [Pseudonocardia sp. Ae356_Ps1]
MSTGPGPHPRTQDDAVWVEAMTEAYARCLEGPVFAPFAAELARRVAEHRPSRVLEVAAGTGVLTRALLDALPGVEVLATDLNPAMVAHGRRHEPRARWVAAAADRLPAADGTVDVVCCGFGVMFFPDRVAAHAESLRVLAPGGRTVLSTWDTIDTHTWASALVAGLQGVFGPEVPSFLTTVPHGYHDPARIRADLQDARGPAGDRPRRFDGIRIDRVVLDGHARSAAVVAEGFCTGTPLRARIAGRADPATTVRTVAAAMTRILGPGPVTAPMAAHLVEATST